MRGCGVQSSTNELAMPPGMQSGKYNDRCKKVLGFGEFERRLMKIEIPTGSKYDVSRATTDLWVQPHHEALHIEVCESEFSIADRVADSIPGMEWAPN